MTSHAGPVLQHSKARLTKFAAGTPFIGALCIDFIVTSKGPVAFEYDVRLGDPESQAIFPSMDPVTDLAEILLACTSCSLDTTTLRLRSVHSVVVVIVAKGYPDTPETQLLVSVGSHKPGEIMWFVNMHSIIAVKDVTIFHAGLRYDGEQLKSFKGRILSVCGTGPTLRGAREAAYLSLPAICGVGISYRNDIGY